MITDLCTTLDAGLLAEWQALTERSDSSPFAGPNWHLARRETFGDRGVGYLVARCDGALAGIWPLRFGGLLVHPAGAFLSDYLSPLLMPGLEPAVLQAFAAWFERSRTPILDLPRQDGSLPAWTEWLSDVGYKTVSLPGEVCPATALTGGIAGVEGRLPAGLGKRYRYDARRLGREAAFAVDFVPPRDVLEAMAKLMEWHAARFRRRGTPGSFFGRRHVFHERVAWRQAAQGMLRLSRLRLDKRTIALLYAMRGGERYFYFAAGFDPTMSRFSPGFVLLRETIRLAAEEGMRTFDFLRGDEEYKRAWATDRSRLQRVVAVRPSRYGYLALAAMENRTEMALRTRLGG